MNKFIKGSFIFLTGVVSGALTSYIITKKIIEKSKDEEIELLRAYYKNRFPDEPTIKSVEMAEGTKTVKDEDIEPKQVREIEPGVVLRVSNEQYNYTKQYNKKKEEKSAEQYTANHAKPEDLYYEIDSNNAGMEEWDQEYLTYYANSGDLVETMTGDILSIHDVLGPNADNILNDRPDEDTFYFRNALLGIEYEIDCVNEAYISKEIEND